MTLRRVVVETPCEHGEWPIPDLSACEDFGECREVVSGFSPEAIEAAARAMFLKDGNFSAKVWDAHFDTVKEWRDIAEAALNSAWAVDFGWEEGSDNSDSPLPWQARHQGGK